jgi:signal transduction histidine kinase
MLLGVLRTRAGGAPLADLLLRLREVPTGGALRDVLAEALGDPSLRIALWAPSVGHYVDEAGAPVEIGGACTEVPGASGPLAILLHDPALVEDRRMLDSVVVAARLALENERLQAEVRAQLAEVRASRARIVEAGDEQRRRIERDLHDGAQQRLVSLALGLELVRERVGAGADPAVSELLGAVAEEAQGAMLELRELAQGIHPAVLTDQGLHEALHFLASRSRVPVEIRSGLEGRRLPAPIEAAAYFACAESLTNAAKHAHANRVEIALEERDGRLRVEVADDGVGGADPARGSGLRGLADRVSALGGRLEVFDGRARGTRIEVDLPLAEAR